MARTASLSDVEDDVDTRRFLTPALVVVVVVVVEEQHRRTTLEYEEKE